MNKQPIDDEIDDDRSPTGAGPSEPDAVPESAAQDSSTHMDQARVAPIAAAPSPQNSDEVGPEELPPDFWEREVSFEDLPTDRNDDGGSATEERRATRSSPEADQAAPVARRSEQDASSPVDDAPDSSGADTFATLRQLFPGRVLSIEPSETVDDAATEGNGTGPDSGGLDGLSDPSPDDAEGTVAEVD